jgi:hypothetical protein
MNNDNILPPDIIIFVYTGEQEAPQNVTHVVIDRSVKIIPRGAFNGRTKLVSVEFHDGVEKVEQHAFFSCTSLRRLKMPGVIVIENCAFFCCGALTDVEFGDKLETIGVHAFSFCTLLQNIKMSSVRTIGQYSL